MGEAVLCSDVPLVFAIVAATLALICSSFDNGPLVENVGPGEESCGGGVTPFVPAPLSRAATAAALVLASAKILLTSGLLAAFAPGAGAGEPLLDRIFF